jgi:hypothetical protein
MKWYLYSAAVLLTVGGMAEAGTGGLSGMLRDLWANDCARESALAGWTCGNTGFGAARFAGTAGADGSALNSVMMNGGPCMDHLENATRACIMPKKSGRVSKSAAPGKSAKPDSKPVKANAE